MAELKRIPVLCDSCNQVFYIYRFEITGGCKFCRSHSVNQCNEEFAIRRLREMITENPIIGGTVCLKITQRESYLLL